MLPKRLQSSSNEGKILLAIAAVKSHQFTSISAAAKAYQISKATLARRMNGATSREKYIPLNKNLTQAEEEVLIKEILKLDSQGLLPIISFVKEIANIICKIRRTLPIGVNWI